jgi:hypothetical protein
MSRIRRVFSRPLRAGSPTREAIRAQVTYEGRLKVGALRAVL